MPGFLSREHHFALGRARCLPGNIGYLELSGFAIDTARADHARGRAAISRLDGRDHFDVRRNRGGEADSSSNFLISHFTGPDTIASPLGELEIGADELHAGTRCRRCPVRVAPMFPYILTSRGTASAGEDFAFVMHNLNGRRW